MALDLAFTPSGRLKVVEVAVEGDAALSGLVDVESDGRQKKLAKAFEAGQAAGLFLLWTMRFDGRCRRRSSSGAILPLVI